MKPSAHTSGRSLLLAASVASLLASAPTYVLAVTPAAVADSASTLVQCPENLIKDAKVRSASMTRSYLAGPDGAQEVIGRFRIDSRTECALALQPSLRVLDATDPMARLPAAPDSHLKSLDALSALDTDASPKASCPGSAPTARVFAGRCGAGGALIGSAFFVNSHLALTGGEVAAQYNEACVERDGVFHDVHQVRKTGSGNGAAVGLSLMRPVTGGQGVQFVSGPLVMGAAAFGLSAEGRTTGGAHDCNSGTANIDYGNGGFARFYWTSYNLWRPELLAPGGPAYVNSLGNPPFGFHAFYEQLSFQGTNFLHPWIKRFSQSDVSTINLWANTAAPTQPVSITFPGHGATVNSNLPLQVQVSATSATALELDGQPVGNPLTNIAPGSHRLVAYSVGAPNFRHTIQFTAQPQAIADAHEADDTPEQFKPLFDGQRKYHTFHRANDSDWSAFAIGAGVRMNLVMTGAAFGNCAMNLYVHPNYPNGVRQLVRTAQGACTNLVIDAVSPLTPSVSVYFLETKLVGNATSGNTDYNLLATTSPDPIAADAYEVDDTRQQYKALFSGQPQDHNFHRQGDVDWTAFAVGPGTPVRVTVNGLAAERSRVRLFQQIDYPNGPIVEVATAEATASLVVQNTVSHSGPYTVYYVETAPIWSGFYGTASTYRIAVDTF